MRSFLLPIDLLLLLVVAGERADRAEQAAPAVQVARTDEGESKQREAAVRFILQWASRGSKPGEFNFPMDVAVGPGEVVFVSDFYNDRVQKFDSKGKPLASFPVAPQPAGIAVDRSGRVYITHFGRMIGTRTKLERNPDQVSVYDVSGKFLRRWGKTGTGDGEFVQPGGIVISKNGRVDVADQTNRRIQVFDAEGKFLFKWGTPGAKPGQFGGNNREVDRFGGPQFVTLDSAGNVYTTEAAMARVQKFTPDGKCVLAWGDDKDKPGSFGGKFAIEKANIVGPIGICVDNHDCVWVTAVSGRVQQFSSEGKYLRSIGDKQGKEPGQFLVPHGLAADSHGNLYVVDSYNHRIQKFATPP